jgi:mannose-6-phosphate isomerase-like protein (cupin superfamily)
MIFSMKEMIEVYAYDGAGYNPYMIRENWQVAQLNYIVKQGFEDIEKIDIHFETDEVFILLEGEVILITAEKEGDELTFRMKKMEKNIVYNIPKMTWHNIAMSEDAQVIIVENAGTHIQDFDFYYLNAEQKKTMYAEIRKRRRHYT